ncbi:50S ribosomal protein L44e [bacterium]|nr:50S ribosomal protein L44e [bacterium]
MKFPKEIKRYCPTCKKHTLQKVKNEKNRGKNKTHPMSQFSQVRMKLRGLSTGTGNMGKLSRGSLNSWKRFNKKHSKKTDLRFNCTVCGKINVPAGKGYRTKKIVIE